MSDNKLRLTPKKAKEGEQKMSRLLQAYLEGGDEAFNKAFDEVHGTEEEHRKKYPHLYEKGPTKLA